MALLAFARDSARVELTHMDVLDPRQIPYTIVKIALKSFRQILEVEYFFTKRVKRAVVTHPTTDHANGY